MGCFKAGRVARARRAAAGVVVVLCAALVAPTMTAAATETTGPLPTPSLPELTAHPSVRLVADRTVLRDARSRVWRPDHRYARGGRLVRSHRRVAGTASPALYRKARLGVRGYDIPVASPGTYFVDLFIDESRGARPGERVFDVAAEQHTVAQYVDAARSFGRNRAGHVLFAVSVVDRTLNVRLSPRQGRPLIGAVQVDFQKRETFQSTLFNEEFNGPAGHRPSQLRWRYDVGGNGFGNYEQETYTAERRNVSLDGRGHLFIIARHEQWTGSDGITRDYTSGRIKTDGRFSFRYGTATARIHVPAGQGLWPAFWALGGNFPTASWPLCGEIDILENIGKQARAAYATLHGSTTAGDPWHAGRRTVLADPLAHDYHVYEMVWGPSAISMSVDGMTYMAVSDADLPTNQVWTFDHRFFLLLNLAVGGLWPGPPDATTPFPATMAVDYVKVRG